MSCYRNGKTFKTCRSKYYICCYGNSYTNSRSVVAALTCRIVQLAFSRPCPVVACRS